MERHMRGEGITDKPWNQPLTAADLEQDQVLKRAVEILRNWPPKIVAQQSAS